MCFEQIWAKEQRYEIDQKGEVSKPLEKKNDDNAKADAANQENITWEFQVADESEIYGEENSMVAVPMAVGSPVKVTPRDTQSNATTETTWVVSEFVWLPAPMVVVSAELAPFTRTVKVVLEPPAEFADNLTNRFFKLPDRETGNWARDSVIVWLPNRRKLLFTRLAPLLYC